MAIYTYTIAEDGVYSSLDGRQSIKWNAGTVIPLGKAIAFGLPGAAAQQEANEAEESAGDVIRGLVTRDRLAADVAAVVPTEPLTEGAIVQGDATGAPVVVKHRSHSSITVAASDSPAWMQRMADYVCDGTDDHVQWQAAIDEAQATYVSSNVVPVNILPGRYYWSDTVVAGSASILGPDNPSAVVVYWNGSSAATALDKNGPSDHPFNTSSWMLRNIRFVPGTSYPNIWLDLANEQYVDAMCFLDRCQWVDGNIAINVGNWINCHWTRLRWDAWREYAVVLSPLAVTFFSDFLIDSFACDNRNSSINQSGPYGSGFMKVVVPNGSLDKGTIALKNARMEFNDPVSSPFGLIHIEDQAPTTPSIGAFHLHLEDLAIQNSSGGTMYLLSRTSVASANGQQRLTFDNVLTSGLTAVLGGTWPTDSNSIPLVSTGWHRLTAGGETAVIQSAIKSQSTAASILAISSRVKGDTTDRFAIKADGRLEWSTGTAAADAILYRTGGNLRTGSNIVVDQKVLTTGGIGVGNSAAATTPGTVTKKMQVFDASGNSLGYVAIYDAIS